MEEYAPVLLGITSCAAAVAVPLSALENALVMTISEHGFLERVNEHSIFDQTPTTTHCHDKLDPALRLVGGEIRTVLAKFKHDSKMAI